MKLFLIILTFFILCSAALAEKSVIDLPPSSSLQDENFEIKELKSDSVIRSKEYGFSFEVEKGGAIIFEKADASSLFTIRYMSSLDPTKLQYFLIISQSKVVDTNARLRRLLSQHQKNGLKAREAIAADGMWFIEVADIPLLKEATKSASCVTWMVKNHSRQFTIFGGVQRDTEKDILSKKLRRIFSSFAVSKI
ncbi:MAG: hypothetical protein K2Q26_00300 [Bdellovibrionales bacterium]|nr:hypothetical protein [Bdellovibrionales bacterium]